MMDTIPLRVTNAALMASGKCEEGGGVEYQIKYNHGIDMVDHSDNPQSGVFNIFKGSNTTTTLQTYCIGEIICFLS